MITGDAEVVVIPRQPARQPFSLPLHRFVPVLLAPQPDLVQLSREALRHRLPLDHPSPRARMRPVVCEPEKVEGRALVVVTARWCVLQQTRFVGVLVRREQDGVG